MRGRDSGGLLFPAFTGLVFCLTACVSDDEATLRERSPPVEVVAAETPLESTSAELTLQQQVDLARTDLVRHRDIDPGSIGVAEARSVTWRSGALGCPQPDMFYTQALVPGSLIVLQVDRKMFAYHASRGGQPFHCPPDRAESPAPGSSASEL